jgi:hypothetical protein
VANEQAVQLGSGISEILHAAALSAAGVATPDDCWRTASIEFDRRQGWTRQFAEQWISQRLGVCDLGRTIHLGVLQRMEPRLGMFLAGILSHAKPRPARQEDTSNAAAAAVEFVPVPALAKNSLLRRGGAGVELDLADQRQRERLPIELRGTLPKDGIVNHFEAQAVVRGLSELAVQLSAAIPSKPSPHQNGSLATVAVLALYPAQEALIRQLVERAPALADAPMRIEIGVPAAFRQREAAVVLLSLTRSHTHRPVAYGTDPEMLALAMTRACSRLIVFGDAGTLVRRSHWDGPLEHLDKVAATREQQLVSHLVHCLDDRGQDRRAFSLRQGSGS